MQRSQIPSGAKPEVVAAKILEVWHVWLPLGIAVVMALIEGGWFGVVLFAVIALGGLIALALRLTRPESEL